VDTRENRDEEKIWKERLIKLYANDEKCDAKWIARKYNDSVMKKIKK